MLLVVAVVVELEEVAVVDVVEGVVADVVLLEADVFALEELVLEVDAVVGDVVLVDVSVEEREDVVVKDGEDDVVELDGGITG